MNMRKMSAAAVMMLMLMSAVSCGDKNKEISGSETAVTIPSVDAGSDVVAAEDGPKLSFSETEAAPGEIAEVSLYVKDAQAKWSMCGIHVTFSDELECQMEDPAENLIKYDTGDASKYATGSVGMLWTNELPEELTSQHLGSLFFTEIFKGDQGLDGEIAKFYFKVPENAASGTVYPIGIYYMEGNDLFINAANDASFQKYAFENWKGGSITVK